MALKSAEIVDLWRKSSGFADFENIVDRGSWIVDRGLVVIFHADSGLCLFYARNLPGPKRNLDHRSLFSLGRNVNEFIQIIIFIFEKSSF